MAMWWKTRVAFAVTGVLVGFSVFFCFAFAYNNWHTAIWGLLSGVMAGTNLYLHLRYKHDRFMSYPKEIRNWMFFAYVVVVGTFCGIFYYIPAAMLEHQKLTAHGSRAFYLTSIWCIMVLKWSVSLSMFANDYKKRYERETGSSLDSPDYNQI